MAHGERALRGGELGPNLGKRVDERTRPTGDRARGGRRDVIDRSPEATQLRFRVLDPRTRLLSLAVGVPRPAIAARSDAIGTRVATRGTGITREDLREVDTPPAFSPPARVGGPGALRRSAPRRRRDRPAASPRPPLGVVATAPRRRCDRPATSP